MLPLALAAALALTSGQVVDADDAWEQGWDDDEDAYDEERAPRLSISGFGGALWDLDEGGTESAYGGEISYAFDPIEVGLYGAAYRLPEDEDGEYSPVVLVRLIQRFPTYRGLDAMFALGIGAAEVEDWDAWFQVALGMRLQVAGPAFLSGELSFEQNDLLRLVGGIGVRF